MVEKQRENSPQSKKQSREGRWDIQSSKTHKHTNENTQKKDAEEAQQVWRERGGLA